MPINLPKPIAAYFEADRGRNANLVIRCFAEGAVVQDEGKTYAGHDAIRQWKAKSSTAYSYTAEPVAAAAEGRRTVVTSHLEGDFPGSPIDLRYFFLLEGEKITELEITL